MRNIKRKVSQNLMQSRRAIFEAAGVTDVSSSTRSNILKTMGRVLKADTRPPLNSKHKEKRLQWAQKYLKQDFQMVLFTDECRATLDGPDGWSSGWVARGQAPPTRMRRQQGGGGVMFWAGIIKKEVLGPFRVPDGVKMNAKTYSAFLKEHLEPWLKRKPASFKKKFVFMRDNAPSHAAKYTTEFLASLGIKEDRLMTWPPCSPDLNPIENYWSILKRHIYLNGRQFKSKDELWGAVLDAVKLVKSDQVESLTNSVDGCLLEVVAQKGGYVKK